MCTENTVSVQMTCAYVYAYGFIYIFMCRVAVGDVPTDRSPDVLAFAMEDLASRGEDGTIMAWFTAGVITEDHVVNQFNLQQRYPDIFGVPAQAQTHPRCGSCRSRQVEEKLVGRLYITMLLERSACAYIYMYIYTHAYIYIHID
jgi:hypothetical protein